MQLIVPCLFGLEGLAGDELRRLNMENVRVDAISRAILPPIRH